MKMLVLIEQIWHYREKMHCFVHLLLDLILFSRKFYIVNVNMLSYVEDFRTEILKVAGVSRNIYFRGGV
jgi:hypothetical protein